MPTTRSTDGDDTHLRLMCPQWQGGGTSSVRELASEFPFDVARRGYAVGSAVLDAVLSPHNGPTAAERSAALPRDHESHAAVEPGGGVADVDVEGQPVVAVLGSAGGEGVEQATTDAAAAFGGRHRDDELGDLHALGRHDQRTVPEVPPRRPDRVAIVVERQHGRVR